MTDSYEPSPEETAYMEEHHPAAMLTVGPVQGPCVYCGNTEGPFKPHHGGDPVCQDDGACLGRGYGGSTFASSI